MPLSKLDANPLLINFPNGTYDASKRERKLRDHDPKDYITRLCPTEYDPDAKDEVWERVTTAAPGFADYQRKTDRVIPLLRLTRVS